MAEIRRFASRVDGSGPPLVHDLPTFWPRFMYQDVRADGSFGSPDVRGRGSVVVARRNRPGFTPFVCPEGFHNNRYAVAMNFEQRRAGRPSLGGSPDD